MVTSDVSSLLGVDKITDRTLERGVLHQKRRVCCLVVRCFLLLLYQSNAELLDDKSQARVTTTTKDPTTFARRLTLHSMRVTI